MSFLEFHRYWLICDIYPRYTVHLAVKSLDIKVRIVVNFQASPVGIDLLKGSRTLLSMIRIPSGLHEEACWLACSLVSHGVTMSLLHLCGSFILRRWRMSCGLLRLAVRTELCHERETYPGQAFVLVL